MRNGNRVYRWARKRGLSESDAADIVQQVFIDVARAFSGFDRHQPGGTFRGWLYRITENRVTDHFRKLERQPSLAVGGTTHAGLLMEVAEEISSPSQPQTVRQPTEREREAIERVRKRCDPKTWAIFWRHVADDCAAADVAEEFGVDVNVVYLARSRITRRIRKELL